MRTALSRINVHFVGIVRYNCSYEHEYGKGLFASDAQHCQGSE